ncbi:MAG: nitroreductase family protein [Limnochordia bacterium]|jgi:nitroreductase|nr:nitroreductase family protein [Bacillota bacterium]NLL08576.1 nitroreductase [Bacillota bacterium]HBG09408.1 nitroreductase [Bacillota bacterium]
MSSSFFDLVAQRYSVRTFSQEPVEKDKILQILEAARLAPSAVNYQPWRFIVATDEDLKAEICQAYRGEWLRNAPVIIVACADHEQSWKRRDGKDHCDVDIAIAVDHLILAATELGLGTCWVCAFDAERLHAILDLPEHVEPIVLIPLGYPGEGPVPMKKRKALEEIVSWNR